MQAQQNNAIIFRPGPGLRDRLKAVADAQGMTISQVVRAACENYVANEPSPRVPVVGTITGGPEDAALWEAIKKVFQANFQESKNENDGIPEELDNHVVFYQGFEPYPGFKSKGRAK